MQMCVFFECFFWILIYIGVSVFVCWCFVTIFKNRCFFDGIFEELFIYVFCVCFFAVFLGVFLGVFWLFFCSWVFSRAFSKFVFYSGCFFVIYLKMGVFFVCVFFSSVSEVAVCSLVFKVFFFIRIFYLFLGIFCCWFFQCFFAWFFVFRWLFGAILKFVFYSGCL